MATLSFPPLVRERPRLQSCVHHIVEIFSGARDGLVMAARYDALAKLSRVELARLGLTRADISRVVASGSPVPGQPPACARR